eukprot:SAG31_NODE_2622_length_5362_cov_2.274178_5_plen_97_part_00
MELNREGGDERTESMMCVRVFLYPMPWYGGGVSPRPQQQRPRELEISVDPASLVIATVWKRLEHENLPMGRGVEVLTVAAAIAQHGAGHDGAFRLQ